jgi:hypothetical protein
MKTLIRLRKTYRDFSFRLKRTRVFRLFADLFKKKKLVRLSFFLLTVAFFVALESVFFKPHNIDWFFERVFIEYGFEEPELMSRLKIFDRQN